ncbi:MAG: hypothetical protein ABSE73_31460 [Planctomycetota bacterium]
MAYTMCAEPKPQQVPPANGSGGLVTRRRSDGELFRLAMEEAQRYKWIRSEEAGRDLGEAALWDWCKRYWWRWCRDRWIEHLSGEEYWCELDHDDFGLLQRGFHRDDPLAQEIISQIKRGGENLNIINWALDKKQDMRKVLEILELLNINSSRLSFWPT